MSLHFFDQFMLLDEFPILNGLQNFHLEKSFYLNCTVSFNFLLKKKKRQPKKARILGS